MENLPACKMERIQITDPFILAGFSVLYASLRLWLGLVRQPIQILVDSQDYLYNAAMPLNLDFFLYSKPAGTALVYKLLGGSYEAIAAFQVGFSIFCWLIFAWVIASRLQTRWVRLAGFSLILVSSLGRDYLAWDTAILSESLSLSLMALFMAACILLVSSKSWVWVGFALLSGSCWALVKESNALMLCLTGLLLMGAGLLLWRGKRFLLTGVLLCLVFFFTQGFSNLGERWKFPMLNLIGQRVLTDPAMLAYFESGGMPANDALLELQNAWGNSQDFAFLNSPELREFQSWFHSQGKAAYYRYLIRHPYRSITAPFQHADEMLSPAQPAGAGLRLSVGWHSGFFVLYAALVALCICSAFILERNSLAWYLLITLLLVLPHLWIVWNGDAMEVTRHALQLRAHFYFGCLLALLLGVDSAVWMRRERIGLDWRAAAGRLVAGFSPPLVILSRAMLAGGILLTFFALLYDFILAPSYFEYSFHIGRGQLAGLLGGALIAAAGAAVAEAFRRRTNPSGRAVKA